MATTRNRIIYQSEALFVSQTATGQHFSSGNSGVNNITQLHRVQTVNDSLTFNRQDVTQLGQLDPLDELVVDPPTVSVDFTYLVSNVLNESRLGFIVDGSASLISGIITKQSDEKNYFLATVPEGFDIVGYGGEYSTYDVRAWGNGFISSYNVQGAVGGLPSASVNVLAVNTSYYTGGSGFNIPAINPASGTPITDWQFTIPSAVSGAAGQVPAIRPAEIQVDIGDPLLGINVTGIKLQSYNISFDLNREDLNQLGSFYPFSKEIQFPVPVNASIEFNPADLKTGDTDTILCNDRQYDLVITLNKPCSTDTAVQYTLKGAKLDGQDTTASIGPSKSVTANFSSRLSANNQNRGLFISGTLT